MKYLVVGLGSMGKRRLRCLKALGVDTGDMAGFDLRADRRAEAASTLNVATYDDFNAALEQFRPDALIISVPPDYHHIYMRAAAERKIHFFVEASVTDDGMEDIIRLSREAGIVAAPSSTFYHHAGIRQVFEIIQSGRLGTLSNILYHSGQYLPDWHVYESVSDFYVSNPATGGAREIVPFELTWLVKLFGFPTRVAGTYRKTIEIKGAEKIEDTYNCLLDYGDFTVNMVVDVVSRIATRRLLINGDKGQLRWDWDNKTIDVYDPSAKTWENIRYDGGQAKEGYNVNIGEKMYIDELGAFIDAAKGGSPFPNTLAEDHNVLKILYAVEESDKTSRFIPIPFSGRG